MTAVIPQVSIGKDEGRMLELNISRSKYMGKSLDGEKNWLPPKESIMPSKESHRV